MTLALRVAGASLVLLAFFHAALWRALGWGTEMRRLSALSARVFAVHTFFIAFVLLALGLLSLTCPELLLDQSDLARVLLGAIVLFWVARLVIQPLVFDRVMRDGWTRSRLVRHGATALWLAYVAVYGAAFLVQIGALTR